MTIIKHHKTVKQFMPLVITIHHNSETWIHFQTILGPKKPPLNRWVFFPGGNFWSLAWRGKSAKSRRTGIKCTKGLNLQGWVLGHPVDEHYFLLREKKWSLKKIEKTKRGLYKSWMGVDKWKDWSWNLFFERMWDEWGNNYYWYLRWEPKCVSGTKFLLWL